MKRHAQASPNVHERKFHNNFLLNDIFCCHFSLHVPGVCVGILNLIVLISESFIPTLEMEFFRNTPHKVHPKL